VLCSELNHFYSVLGNDFFSEIFNNSYSNSFSPTSVDAFVFGYLAPLIRGPASNSALARYASSRKNLRDFVDRILTVYLGDLGRFSPKLSFSNANKFLFSEKSRCQ
jgi:hypothetical protein